MAKKRHIFRKSIKSFFERYTDPAKHDELKATRKEMEEKKLEILKLIQNEEQKDGTKTTSLSDLIEDFHKQYESLYDHYEQLTGEMNNKHRHSASSSISSITESSDSDSDKSQKETTDGLQHELEESKLEVMLLENTLEVVCNKNDTLTRKLEETENVVENLKVDNETLNSEKEGLKLEIEELIREKENAVKRLEEGENDSRLKMSDFLMEMRALKQELIEKDENFMTAEKRYQEEIEELIREKDGLAIEKENAVRRLKDGENELELKVSDFLKEISGLKEELTEKDENFMTAEKRYEEEIEELIRDKDALAIEKENAVKRLEEGENDSRLTISEFLKEIRDLKHELTEKEENFMTAEKRYEEEIEELIREKDGLVIEKENAVKRLEEGENDLCLKISEFLKEIRDLKHELIEKEEDFMTTEKIYQDEINRLSANSAAYRETITSISENVKRSVSGLEIVCRNFEEDNEKFLTRMYRMSEEIQILRYCVAGKNAESEILMEKLRNLTEELQNEKEYGLSVNLLLKKKNEQAEILADEKREAIRQLCLWNDDVQSRYNELKSAVGKPGLQQRQSYFVKCITETN